MNHYVSAYAGFGPLFDVKSNGRSDRLFMPEEDHYPPPLMSSSPSYRMAGSELQMAITYFQYQRVEQLIAEHQDVDVPAEVMADLDRYLKPVFAERDRHGQTYDEFKSKVLAKNPTYDRLVINWGRPTAWVDVYQSPHHAIYHDLCSLAGPNMASNVPYEGNEFIWNKTLETLLNAYSTDNLSRLMASLGHDGQALPVSTAIGAKRPLTALVLVHFGCSLPDDAEQLLGKALCARIERALAANLPNGQRLRPLIGQCGITLEDIKEPLLLGDGHVYECEAALRWLSQSFASPLLNTPLDEHWFGFNLITNRFVYADYVSSEDKRKALDIDRLHGLIK
jgi:hypothetical protein